MNNKIPLRVLAQQMAQASGLSENECQEFVKALFRYVSEDLYCGKAIVVDGIGTFSVDTACSDPIQYEVDANLASELNAPFSFFQPMTLSGSLDQEKAEMFNEITVEIDPAQEDVEPVASVDHTQINEYVVSEESIPVENTPLEETETEDGMVDDDSIADSKSDEESVDLTPAAPIATAVSSDCDTNNLPDILDVPGDESSLQESACEKDQNQTDEELASETIDPVEDTLPSETNQICIPEEDEEYVEYHTQRRSSRFWLGFIIGLLTGLVLAAVALAIYVVQFLNYPLSSLS